jgi:hypothetical protein
MLWVIRLENAYLARCMPDLPAYTLVGIDKTRLPLSKTAPPVDHIAMENLDQIVYVL